MKLYLSLNEDEIRKTLPYALICETRESSVWDTRKRRMLWKERFTESERDYASTIFALCHKWYLKTGVPDEYKLSFKSLELWNKIAAFCMEL